MAIDEADFMAMLLRQLDEAFRVATWILGDPVTAEDAVQEATTRAWGARRSLREPAQLAAWFGRIVVNTCRDELRRRGRRPTTADLSLAEFLPDASVRNDTPERDEVARALGRLSVDARVVLALRYGADLTVPAIAARLGIPEGTAKTRLRDSLEAARRALDSERAAAIRAEEARA
ncbi:MAG TPA: sigma-70 family RNA polymerase sigma factor [Candidatus Limnocylindrales bacterium]